MKYLKIGFIVFLFFSCAKEEEPETVLENQEATIRVFDFEVWAEDTLSISIQRQDSTIFACSWNDFIGLSERDQFKLMLVMELCEWAIDLTPQEKRDGVARYIAELLNEIELEE